jgi:hypothetical protein
MSGKLSQDKTGEYYGWLSITALKCKPWQQMACVKSSRFPEEGQTIKLELKHLVKGVNPHPCYGPNHNQAQNADHDLESYPWQHQDHL